MIVDGCHSNEGVGGGAYRTGGLDIFNHSVERGNEEATNQTITTRFSYNQK